MGWRDLSSPPSCKSPRISGFACFGGKINMAKKLARTAFQHLSFSAWRKQGHQTEIQGMLCAACCAKGLSSCLALASSCCECATCNGICICFLQSWSQSWLGLNVFWVFQMFAILMWTPTPLLQASHEGQKKQISSEQPEGRWMNWFHYAFVHFLSPLEFLMHLN